MNLEEVMEDTLISVVIPVYNREETIKGAVESILKQTYQNFELILVDDCSSDRSVEVMKTISDPRIRLICHEKNMGACAARNTGVRAAKGTYIAFNDSDDEWRPEKLEHQKKALEQNKADVVFCQMERHNYGDAQKDESRNGLFPDLPEGFVDYETLIVKSRCSTQTIFGRAEVFHEFPFDDTLPRMQDYDFVIRAAQKYRFYFLKESLVDVYLQPNSLTSKNHQKLYDMGKIFTKKYSYLFDKYPKFELSILEPVGYYQVELGENAYPTFRRIYQIEKTPRNFVKMIASKTGLLHMIWFHGKA